MTGMKTGAGTKASEKTGADGAFPSLLRTDPVLLAPCIVSGNRKRGGKEALFAGPLPPRGARMRAMGVLLSVVAVLVQLSVFDRSSDEADRAVQPKGASVTIPLGSPSEERPLPLPPVLGPADPERPLVVIDPGHGGRDPGAISPFESVPEKDVTLAIARAIRDEIAASGRVRVALTRNGDDHLLLHQRYQIARRLGAGLFISVHADAAQREGARGASIYTLSEVASDREAAQLAARENASAVDGAAMLSSDSGVNRILIDLVQREAMTHSAGFARLLHREAAPLIPFQPDYHRFASLMVLKAPDIPSILFETGYLTNPEDAAFVQSQEGRRRIARGVRSAVETHFARRALASTHD